MSGLENVTEHYTHTPMYVGHTPKFRILFTTFGIYIDKLDFFSSRLRSLLHTVE